MRIDFEDKKLEALYTRNQNNKDYPPEVVKAFFKKIAILRAAQTEQDLSSLRSLCYKKLHGTRRHQYSIRLNDQWRFILERKSDEKGFLLLIVSVTDYHSRRVR